MLLFSFVLMFALGHCSTNRSPWHSMNHQSTGIAPDPLVTKEAVIEFYSANSHGWRGIFSVHTWFAIKTQNAEKYSVYEVEGWRVKNGKSAIHHYETPTPDKYWYGAKPEKILSIRGDKATHLIPVIVDAIHRYPWRNEYSSFPGPNNNTFPAWIGVQIPELQLSMPLRAIGSGYAG